jgi:hypothetical protein
LLLALRIAPAFEWSMLGGALKYRDVVGLQRDMFHCAIVQNVRHFRREIKEFVMQRMWWERQPATLRSKPQY